MQTNIDKWTVNRAFVSVFVDIKICPRYRHKSVAVAYSKDVFARRCTK